MCDVLEREGCVRGNCVFSTIEERASKGHEMNESIWTVVSANVANVVSAPGLTRLALNTFAEPRLAAGDSNGSIMSEIVSTMAGNLGTPAELA